MGGNFGGPTFWVILLVILLLFGAPKLPALARSLGQSMKILKKEVGGENKDEAAPGEAGGAATPAAPQATAAPEADPRDLEIERARAEAAEAKAQLEALRAQAAARTDASEAADAAKPGDEAK